MLCACVYRCSIYACVDTHYFHTVATIAIFWNIDFIRHNQHETQHELSFSKVLSFFNRAYRTLEKSIQKLNFPQEVFLCKILKI